MEIKEEYLHETTVSEWESSLFTFSFELRRKLFSQLDFFFVFELPDSEPESEILYAAEADMFGKFEKSSVRSDLWGSFRGERCGGETGGGSVVEEEKSHFDLSIITLINLNKTLEKN